MSSRSGLREPERTAGTQDGSVTLRAVQTDVITRKKRLRVTDLQQHFEHLAALRALQRVQIRAEHGDLHRQHDLRLVIGAYQRRVDRFHAVARLQTPLQPHPNAAAVLHYELIRRVARGHQLRYHHAVAEHIALLRVSGDAAKRMAVLGFEIWRWKCCELTPLKL